MTGPDRPGEPPPGARDLVASLQAAMASVRGEIVVTEVPAPTRIAPYGLALGAHVLGPSAPGAAADGDEDAGEPAAVGRLVLLHDPDGQDAWEGCSRFVCYARAALDAEMVSDPLLPEVAWSWLQDALGRHQAGHHALGGTVTTTVSDRFGTLAAGGADHEVEVRCSWSPDGSDGAAHLLAFVDLLASLAGLPPAGAGVVALPRRG
jgi:hypothetical protein